MHLEEHKRRHDRCSNVGIRETTAWSRLYSTLTTALITKQMSRAFKYSEYEKHWLHYWFESCKERVLAITCWKQKLFWFNYSKWKWILSLLIKDSTIHFMSQRLFFLFCWYLLFQEPWLLQICTGTLYIAQVIYIQGQSLYIVCLILF